MRNAFATNIATDIKLSEAQLPKIIQLVGFLLALLGTFTGALMKFAVSLVKNGSEPLAAMITIYATDSAIQRKMRGRGAIGMSGTGVATAGKESI